MEASFKALLFASLVDLVSAFLFLASIWEEVAEKKLSF